MPNDKLSKKDAARAMDFSELSSEDEEYFGYGDLHMGRSLSARENRASLDEWSDDESDTLRKSPKSNSISNRFLRSEVAVKHHAQNDDTCDVLVYAYTVPGKIGEYVLREFKNPGCQWVVKLPGAEMNEVIPSTSPLEYASFAKPSPLEDMSFRIEYNKFEPYLQAIYSNREVDKENRSPQLV